MSAVHRLESVWLGRDNKLLDAMLDFYAPSATHIIDVCCNTRRMWKGSEWGRRVSYYDQNPAVHPDVVARWDKLPHTDGTVDVLVYDPPHLPDAAASPKSLPIYKTDYGLGGGITDDNIGATHAGFLQEAARVLRDDGLIFAKIKDYIHNHRYQWNLELFNTAVRAVGMTPCDLIIKRDPCAGNLKSGRWRVAHHAKNTHCFWVVIRNSPQCQKK